MPHIYRTVPRFTQMRYHILCNQWQAIFNHWWTCRTYLKRLNALAIAWSENKLIATLFSALYFTPSTTGVYPCALWPSNNNLNPIIDHLSAGGKRRNTINDNYYAILSAYNSIAMPVFSLWKSVIWLKSQSYLFNALFLKIKLTLPFIVFPPSPHGCRGRPPHTLCLSLPALCSALSPFPFYPRIVTVWWKLRGLPASAQCTGVPIRVQRLPEMVHASRQVYPVYFIPDKEKRLP